MDTPHQMQLCQNSLKTDLTNLVPKIILELIHVRLLEWDSSQKAGFRKVNLFQKPNLYSPISAPADIYLFKLNNGNTRTKYKICLKLTIKTPERRH